MGILGYFLVVVTVLGAGAERQRTFLLSLENIRQSLDVMARKWEKKKLIQSLNVRLSGQ